MPASPPVETFRDFLVRLGFRAGQHVGSSSTYHYGTPKKVGEYAVLYPILVDIMSQQGPFRAFCWCVWHNGEVVYDEWTEPSAAFIESLVAEVDGLAEGDGGAAAG